MKLFSCFALTIQLLNCFLLVNGENDKVNSLSSSAAASAYVAASDEAVCSSTNPLLLWTGLNSFFSISSSAQKEKVIYYVDSLVHSNDVMNMLLGNNGKTFESLYNDDNKKPSDAASPSLIVGFVFNNVDGIDFSQSQTIKKIIESDAKSSLVISYVDQSGLIETNDFVDQFSSVVNEMKENKFNLVEVDGSNEDSIEKVMNIAKNNKANTVILVTFKKELSLSKVDKSIVAKIQNAVSNIVQDGNYLSFITARVCNNVPQALWNGKEKSINNRRVLSEQAVPISDSVTYSNSTWKVRNRPEVLTGMLSTLLLGLVLLVYFCCMHDIQAGSSFATKYPAKGKEFN